MSGLEWNACLNEQKSCIKYKNCNSLFVQRQVKRNLEHLDCTGITTQGHPVNPRSMPRGMRNQMFPAAPTTVGQPQFPTNIPLYKLGRGRGRGGGRGGGKRKGKF